MRTSRALATSWRVGQPRPRWRTRPKGPPTPRSGFSAVAWRAPGPDCRDDLVGGVLLDVVTGAFEDDGVVVGEELLPAASFAIAEGDVLRRPYEECGAIREFGQPAFDVREERPAIEDLARKDRRWPPRGGRLERPPVSIHHRVGQGYLAHTPRQRLFDKEVAVGDQAAADRPSEHS